ncbi:hypothetical protein BV898_01450 [Hypsibius exemplaris]|uniref:Secreted protein n=1 Tax=Hypsibius exemplaris TaxID=2072580 RepID=A0A1W0XBP2_HYPEX|nr:hypothetical protein BV898_01450 [Hypsibius exemplaris]
MKVALCLLLVGVLATVSAQPALPSRGGTTTNLQGGGFLYTFQQPWYQGVQAPSGGLQTFNAAGAVPNFPGSGGSTGGDHRGPVTGQDQTFVVFFYQLVAFVVLFTRQEAVPVDEVAADDVLDRGLTAVGLVAEVADDDLDVEVVDPSRALANAVEGARAVVVIDVDEAAAEAIRRSTTPSHAHIHHPATQFVGQSKFLTHLSSGGLLCTLFLCRSIAWKPACASTRCCVGGRVGQKRVTMKMCGKFLPVAR